jgi:hypothetical protein
MKLACVIRLRCTVNARHLVKARRHLVQESCENNSYLSSSEMHQPRDIFKILCFMYVFKEGIRSEMSVRLGKTWIWPASCDGNG